MTNEYNYVDHAEPSEIDELFKDFQKKCIDTLYNNVESEIDAIIKQNAQLTKENEKLRKQNKSLENIAIERTKSLNNSSTVLKMLEHLKNSYPKILNSSHIHNSCNSHDYTLYQRKYLIPAPSNQWAT